LIVYLEGNLHRIQEDSIVLLTQGVGYQIHLSKPALDRLPTLGSKLTLHIHSVIREDSHQLFGFQSEVEKTLFLKLIQVSSIGPKMALNILSGLPAPELAHAIHHEDLVRITAIPGIGKKTAERLIVDLKDKILGLLGPTSSALSSEIPGAPSSLMDEALSALTNLGYSPQEAQKALRTLPPDEKWTLETLLREGLKALS